MADIAKALKGCEVCSEEGFCLGHEKGCPYWPDFNCKQLVYDCIELLKELKEIKDGITPELEGDPGNGYWHVCGECHGAIGSNDQFCRHCGRKVLWDARQTEEH